MTTLTELKQMLADIETKVRRVRTPEGAKRYGLPIGSIIVRKGRLKNLTIDEDDPEFPGWEYVKGTNGKNYGIGKDGGKWIATPDDGWDAVVEGTSKDDVYDKLDRLVGKEGGGTEVPEREPGELRGSYTFEQLDQMSPDELADEVDKVAERLADDTDTTAEADYRDLERFIDYREQYDAEEAGIDDEAPDKQERLDAWEAENGIDGLTRPASAAPGEEEREDVVTPKTTRKDQKRAKADREEAWALHAETQYTAAEAATNGNMVNQAGKAAGITERQVSDGDAKFVAKWASEEMLNHIEANGRQSKAEIDAPGSAKAEAEKDLNSRLSVDGAKDILQRAPRRRRTTNGNALPAKQALPEGITSEGPDEDYPDWERLDAYGETLYVGQDDDGNWVVTDDEDQVFVTAGSRLEAIQGIPDLYEDDGDGPDDEGAGDDDTEGTAPTGEPVAGGDVPITWEDYPSGISYAEGDIDGQDYDATVEPSTVNPGRFQVTTRLYSGEAPRGEDARDSQTVGSLEEGKAAVQRKLNEWRDAKGEVGQKPAKPEEDIMERLAREGAERRAAEKIDRQRRAEAVRRSPRGLLNSTLLANYERAEKAGDARRAEGYLQTAERDVATGQEREERYERLKAAAEAYEMPGNVTDPRAHGIPGPGGQIVGKRTGQSTRPLSGILARDENGDEWLVENSTDGGVTTGDAHKWNVRQQAWQKSSVYSSTLKLSPAITDPGPDNGDTTNRPPNPSVPGARPLADGEETDTRDATQVRVGERIGTYGAYSESSNGVRTFAKVSNIDFDNASEQYTFRFEGGGSMTVGRADRVERVMQEGLEEEPNPEPRGRLTPAEIKTLRDATGAEHQAAETDWWFYHRGMVEENFTDAGMPLDKEAVDEATRDSINQESTGEPYDPESNLRDARKLLANRAASRTPEPAPTPPAPSKPARDKSPGKKALYEELEPGDVFSSIPGGRPLRVLSVEPSVDQYKVKLRTRSADGDVQITEYPIGYEATYASQTAVPDKEFDPIVSKPDRGEAPYKPSPLERRNMTPKQRLESDAEQMRFKYGYDSRWGLSAEGASGMTSTISKLKPGDRIYAGRLGWVEGPNGERIETRELPGAKGGYLSSYEKGANTIAVVDRVEKVDGKYRVYFTDGTRTWQYGDGGEGAQRRIVAPFADVVTGDDGIERWDTTDHPVASGKLKTIAMLEPGDVFRLPNTTEKIRVDNVTSLRGGASYKVEGTKEDGSGFTSAFFDDKVVMVVPVDEDYGKRLDEAKLDRAARTYIGVARGVMRSIGNDIVAHYSGDEQVQRAFDSGDVDRIYSALIASDKRYTEQVMNDGFETDPYKRKYQLLGPADVGLRDSDNAMAQFQLGLFNQGLARKMRDDLFASVQEAEAEGFPVGQAWDSWQAMPPEYNYEVMAKAIVRPVIRAGFDLDAAGPGQMTTPAPDFGRVKGATIRDRMAAYREMLPANRSEIGTVPIMSPKLVPKTALDDFDLDNLLAGREINVTSGIGDRKKQYAPDGGPTAETMQQLDVVKAAGKELLTEVNRRVEERTRELSGGQSLDDLAQAMSRAQLQHSKDVMEIDWTKVGASTEAMKRAERSQQVYSDAMQALQAAKGKQGAIRRDAALEVVREARQLGGVKLEYLAGTFDEKDPRDFRSTNRPRRALDGDDLAGMRNAESMYPSDWLQALKSHRPSSAAYTLNGDAKPDEEVPWQITSNLGFFMPGTHRISLHKFRDQVGGDKYIPQSEAAMHEMGHAMQSYVPGVGPLEEAYYWSRTSTGEVGSRNRTRRVAERFNTMTGEKTSYYYEGGWAASYSGRDYGAGPGTSSQNPGSYETIPTATQYLFHGNNDYNDPDLAAFMLGAMATI